MPGPRSATSISSSRWRLEEVSVIGSPGVPYLAALSTKTSTACKDSTRFGESLSREEMEILLKEWSSTVFSEICPHERPIVKRLALPDLLREFGRL